MQFAVTVTVTVTDLHEMFGVRWWDVGAGAVLGLVGGRSGGGNCGVELGLGTEAHGEDGFDAEDADHK